MHSVTVGTSTLHFYTSEQNKLTGDYFTLVFQPSSKTATESRPSAISLKVCLYETMVNVNAMVHVNAPLGLMNTELL